MKPKNTKYFALKSQSPNIVLLCGGVGGTKLAEGFYHSKYRDNLKIIGNVADDQEFHGLWVSPDIDTLTYTLADVINKEQGWGRADESTNTLSALKQLGVDTWMFLGDKDFATHIYRTEQRKKGVLPEKIAEAIARQLGVKVPILLPTNDVIQTRVQTKVQTVIDTEETWLPFQDYFVKHQCKPEIKSIEISGIKQARATNAALEAIKDADIIIIAPSNPVVSIAPIIEIPQIKQALQQSSAQVVAVSPFFKGKTVKGPADKMMLAMGYENSNVGLLDFYQQASGLNEADNLINFLIIDQNDSADCDHLALGVKQVMAINTLMNNRQEKINLAESLMTLTGFAGNPVEQRKNIAEQYL
ncbi:MAG: 2-phospho-L-lactate transferase [Gammaproteobacteria bacterium]|nr:MAG: 2-phospho-L-lactate transferase [Gammaproteobacteria bacterium]